MLVRDDIVIYVRGRGARGTESERMHHMKRVFGGIAAAVAIAAVSMTAGTATAQDASRVTFLHGIPGVPIDISIAGSVAFSNVQPQQTADLNQYRGQTLADVVLLEAGTETAISTPTSLAIPDAGSWNVVAHYDAAGTPVISSYENNLAPVAAGSGRLTVRHTAAAEAVDIIIGGERPISGLAPGSSRELELPAGDITDAQLALTGQDPLVDMPTLTIAEGSNLIVYVVGPSDASTFDFYTQTAALTVPDTTTTTDPNATTTTTTPNASTTTVDGATTTTAAETTTTAAVPTAVNTGSPLDNSVNTTLVVVAIGAVLVAGGAMFARRRVGS